MSKDETEDNKPADVAEEASSSDAEQADKTIVVSAEELASLRAESDDSKDTPDFVAKGFMTQGTSLLAIASPILGIISALKRPQSNIDLAKLRKSMNLEIDSFNIKAKNNGFSAQQISLARYALCAVIDEFVLDTPWGANSNWSEHSLLNTFHQDSSGGEKFFTILSKLQQDVAVNIELIRLMYTCISLGFLGKYRIMSGGEQELRKIKHSLYKKIKKTTADNENTLSDNVSPLDAKNVNIIKRVPVRVLTLIIAISLLVVYSTASLVLYQKSQGVIKDLRGIVVENALLPKTGSRSTS
jgi:type VI secretion system protein ImpK